MHCADCDVAMCARDQSSILVLAGNSALSISFYWEFHALTLVARCYVFLTQNTYTTVEPSFIQWSQSTMLFSLV